MSPDHSFSHYPPSLFHTIFFLLNFPPTPQSLYSGSNFTVKTKITRREIVHRLLPPHHCLNSEYSIMLRLLSCYQRWVAPAPIYSKDITLAILLSCFYIIIFFSLCYIIPTNMQTGYIPHLKNKSIFSCPFFPCQYQPVLAKIFKYLSIFTVFSFPPSILSCYNLNWGRICIQLHSPIRWVLTNVVM